MVRDSEEDALDVYEIAARYTFGNDVALSLAVQGTEADLDDGTGTLIGNNNDELVVGALKHRIVSTDLLDIASVAALAAVDGYDFIVRTVFGALAVESERN